MVREESWGKETCVMSRKTPPQRLGGVQGVGQVELSRPDMPVNNCPPGPCTSVQWTTVAVPMAQLVPWDGRTGCRE